MTKMSEKMQRVYDQIRYDVEYARTHSFDEMYGVENRDCQVLLDLYEEKQDGIVRGCWDGRTLCALERRGLIRYYDDMSNDEWVVMLAK